MASKHNSKIWPNHRSQPLRGTKFYRWVLWIEGDESVLRTISKVKYILHPTFNEGEIESSDASFNFRIEATGWGSFYIRVIVYYDGGFSEQISYLLDVNQFFQREGPPVMKRCPSERINAKQLPQLYADGYRDFSEVIITHDSEKSLLGKELVAADFEKAKLSGLYMVGTNLAMCNFQEADLSETNLAGANLTRARLTCANITGAIPYGVNKTDWLIDGIKATYIFVDGKGGNRVPFGRNFEEEEFSRWLMALKDLDELLPPNSPKVFISYSWKDEEAVLAVDQWLRNHGINVLIDKRDFMVGGDLYEEINNKIITADKVVVFYSENSKDRPYTTLERRIAQQVEARSQGNGTKKILLIYLQLDDEQLPTEVSHRLSIRAKGRSFAEVCEKLLDAILEHKSSSPAVDLTRYKDKPPW